MTDAIQQFAEGVCCLIGMVAVATLIVGALIWLAGRSH